MMRIAILTFEGFNEIDSFVALNILNRVRSDGWRAEITSPTNAVVSMNGVRVEAQRPLEFANEADVVLVGSGRLTQKIVGDNEVMSRLRLDPSRQLIGAQCSGALILAKLGLLATKRVCADSSTRSLIAKQGIEVLDQPFMAEGNVASAGGCLAAHYLATWVMCRKATTAQAEDALRYVVPVGQEADYISRAIGVVRPFL